MATHPHHSVAVLLHAYSWAADSLPRRLSAGIALAPLEGSKVQGVYEKICRRWKIDDSEPLGFEVMATFEPTVDGAYYLDFGDPYSTVARVVNAVALAVGNPPGMCRVIWTRDAFKSAEGTEVTFYSQGQHEFLMPDAGWATINDSVLALVTELWTADRTLERQGSAAYRVRDALQFYYHAWTSHYMEHVCINLATCLELLFSPHAQGETTHQLSFAVARFLGGTRTEVERTYDQVRAFYGLRSAILHGGRPDQDRLIEGTTTAFARVSEILRKVVADPSMSARFCCEETRRQLLRELLFGAA